MLLTLRRTFFIDFARWDYIKARHETCDANFQEKDCIQKAMVTAGVDTSKIDSCLLYSGGLENDQMNPILEELRPNAFPRAPHVSVGDFALGNRPLQDSFSEENIKTTICNGFMEGYKPDICRSTKPESCREPEQEL